MSDLGTALHVVGFLVAALGTLAAVPAGTWRLVDRTEIKARACAKRALDFLLRRKSGSGSAQVVVGTVVASGPRLVAAATGVVSGGSVEERLARVEGRLDESEKQQRKTASDLAQEIVDRTRADDALHAEFFGEVTRLDQELDKQQKAAVEVDAAALPVILGGAALSTFPDWFARHLVLGNLALCVSVGLFFHAWVLLDQARSERGRASAA